MPFRHTPVAHSAGTTLFSTGIGGCVAGMTVKTRRQPVTISIAMVGIRASVPGSYMDTPLTELEARLAAAALA